MRIGFTPTQYSGVESEGSIEFTVAVAFPENLTTEVVVEFYTENGSAQGKKKIVRTYVHTVNDGSRV